MKYWMDKASWHKPSILVLDNIDKLMGTELEVSRAFHACWLASINSPPHRIACRLVPYTTYHRVIPRVVRFDLTLNGTQCERRGPPRSGGITSIPSPSAELLASLPRGCEPKATVQGCA